MSTEVDQRVVEMKFDNVEFEKRANNTIGTLDKLKASLNFTGAAKGVDGLNKALGSVDGSAEDLGGAISKVQMSFSALEVAGISAMTRLTNKVMDAGERMLKSLTIAPVSQGFNEYELKMGSIQTMMMSTGESLETVNKYLEELNLYADKTIYSFSDMTSNIGKFTNAGVKLDKAVKAIQGVSNVAAVSGANANEASRAMYNFAQALSAGYVKLIDWKSIENANMATVEFKNQLLEAAVAQGTLTKTSDGMYKTLKGNTLNATRNFNDTLQDQWMTTETLISVLGKYADETTDIGKKAFAAATEVKTFSQAMDTIKESVGSGWAQTFEILFGDFNEAKKLWTSFANVMSDIFASGGERRNTVLSEWKELGGRQELLKGLNNIFQSIYSVVTKLKSAFRDIFPPKTAEQIYRITQSFVEFTEKLKLSEEATETLRALFKALLIPVKAFAAVIQITSFWIKEFVGLIFTLVDQLLALPQHLDQVEKFFRDTFGDERYVRVVTVLSDIIGKIKNAFVDLISSVGGWFQNNNIIDSLADGLSYLWDIVKPFANFIVDKLVDGLETLSKLDFSSIIGFGKSVLSKVTKWFDFFNAFDSLKDSKPKDLLGDISNGFKQIGESWTKFSSEFTISDFVNNLFEKIKGFASGVGKAITTVTDALGQLIRRLSPAKILAFGFGTAMVTMMFSISHAVDAIGDTMGSLKRTFSSLTDYIRGSRVRSSMFFILTFIASVAALSFIDQGKLWSSVGAVAALSAVVLGLSAALAGLTNIKMSVKKMEQITKSLQALAVVMLSVTLSVATMLSLVDDYEFKNIATVMGVLAVTLTAFVATTYALSLINTKGLSGAWTMVGIALALNMAVSALSSIAKMDLKLVDQQLQYLAWIVVSFLGLSLATSAGSFGSALAMTLLIGDVLLIYKMFKALEPISGKEILSKTGAILVLITSVGAICKLVSTLGKNATWAKDAASALIKFAGALSLIAISIKLFNTIEFSGRTLSSLAMMAAISAGFVLLAKALAKVDSNWNEAQMSKALLNISMAMIPLALSIRILGGLNTKEIVQGTAAIGVLMVTFGLLIKYVSTMGDKDKQITVTTSKIIALIAAIGVLIGAVVVLSLMDTKQILVSAGVIAGLMTALALLIKSVSGFGKKAGPDGFKGFLQKIGNMIVTITTIGLLAAEMIWLLKQLDGMNPETLMKQAEAIALLLGAVTVITIATKAVSKGISADTTKSFNKALLLFIESSAVLSGVVFVIAGLSKLATDQFGNDFFDGITLFTKAFYALIPFLAIASAAAGLFVAFSGFLSKIDIATVSMGILKAFVLIGEVVLGIVAIMAEIVATVSAVGALAGVLNFEENAKQLAAGIGGFFGALTGSFTAAKMDYLSKAAPQMVEFVETLMPLYDVFSKSEIIEGGAKQLANAMDELASIKFDVEYDNARQWADMLGIVQPRLINFYNDIMNAGMGTSDAVARMQNAANTIREFSGVNDAIREAYESNGLVINTLRDNLLAMVKTMSSDSGSFKEAGNGVVVSIVAGIKESSPIFDAASKDMATYIVLWFKTNQSTFVAAGEFIISGIVDGMNSTKSKDALNSVLTKITDSVSDAAKGGSSGTEPMVEIGNYLMSGLDRGIKEKQVGVLNTATNCAKAVIEAFRIKFKVHSPSLVMKEVGEYVMQGLAEGLDTDMSAEEIAEGKAQNIVQAFEDSLNKHLRNMDVDYAKIEQMELLGLDPEAIEKEYDKVAEYELKNQGMTIANAKAKYELMAKTFGEESSYAIAAQAEVIQGQNELLKLETQLEEEKTKRVQERNEAADEARKNEIAAANNMSAAVRKLRDMGLTDEMVKQMGLGEKVGDVAAGATGWQKFMSKKIEKDFTVVEDKLTELEGKYVKPYEFETTIDPKTAAIQRAKDSLSGASEGVSEFTGGDLSETLFGDDNSDAALFAKGDVDGLVESGTEKAKSALEGITDGISGKIDEGVHFFTTKILNKIKGINDEVVTDTTASSDALLANIAEKYGANLDNAVNLSGEKTREAAAVIDENLSVEPSITPYIDDSELDKGIARVQVKLASIGVAAMMGSIQEANAKKAGSGGNNTGGTVINNYNNTNNFEVNKPPTRKEETQITKSIDRATTKFAYDY